MRLSVAMCTYNGARFVAEQLRSIASQTRPPDELVVCDDRSMDETCAIITSHPMPCPVRLTVNEVNLGSTSNFDRAISLCDGDVIVLSDQDDVWLPHKLARIEQAFEASASLGLFASDAMLIDENSRPLGRRLWSQLPFSPQQQEAFRRGEGARLLTRRNYVTGATAAFRADLRWILLPIPKCWIHDGWIAILTAAIADVHLEPDPLILYRQHTAQQTGVALLTLGRQIRTALGQGRAYFENLAECFAAVEERLGEISFRLRIPGLIERVSERAKFARAQARMRSGSRLLRLPRVVGQLVRGRYWRHGIGVGGWKSIAADLVI